MPSTLRVAVFVGLMFVFAPLAHADNWAQFRGPNTTGVATDKNVPVQFGKEDIAWKVKVSPGNASPVIWGNNVFIHASSKSGDQRMLICLDAKTGKEIWTRTIPAVKAHTHQKNTLASSTPVTDGESVFVYFWDGKTTSLAAFNFKGDQLWNRNLGIWESQHGPGASPILYKDTVIITNDMDKFDARKNPVPDPSTVFCLNKKTGDIVWKATREAVRACYTTPIIITRPGKKLPELIVTSSTSVRSYNPDNGDINWSWYWTFAGGIMRSVNSTTYLDGVLFPSTGDGSGARNMFAIDITKANKDTLPTELYRNQKDFPYVPCSITKGKYVYFANDRGIAFCVEGRTGKRVWSARIPDASFTGSPVMIDGKIYAPSEEGDVFVFTAQPSGFELLARNNIGERVRSSLAVANGSLYIRGQNHLFCIKEK